MPRQHLYLHPYPHPFSLGFYREPISLLLPSAAQNKSIQFNLNAHQISAKKCQMKIEISMPGAHLATVEAKRRRQTGCYLLSQLQNCALAKFQKLPLIKFF
ncbi:unnamed protein product [Coffea canephora]|uniref:Uncharacterized protein n=1 Tax=Coffea canephora TaxID=49390 RepID=A0A068V4Z2_COFCA|nr:unnamed protein product [Coffea canephora]